MNKTNKKFIIFYLVLSVIVFTALIYIDSSLEKPSRELNLAPLPLATISYSKIVDVDKEVIFNTFADFKNYPRILPNNILSVTNIPEKQSVYDISLTQMGIIAKLKAEHIIEPYHKQVIEVIDGDAQGTTITQTFEPYDNKTKISIDIDLKTRGILLPFSYLPIINANHAIDTIVQSFVEYSTRSYTLNEKIVDDLYRETLLRPVDIHGLIKYSTLLEEEKITIEEIRNELLNSEEYQSNILHVDLKDISDLSEDTKNSIDELYDIILRRNADTNALQVFGSALENGKMSLSDISKTLLVSDEFHSLPLEHRERTETYRTNEYWQTVHLTYFEVNTLYPTAKIIRAYGIFFERGDLTLNEMKELFEHSSYDTIGFKVEYNAPGCIQEQSLKGCFYGR